MRAPARRAMGGPWPLAGPALVFLAVFFLVPLGQVAWMSISEPSLGPGNYRGVFGSTHVLSVFGHTFATALLVTACCLVPAYPVAYVAARAGPVLATVLLTVVAVSFWTSFLVRTYAWMVIFGTRGPVAAGLVALGWQPPPKLLFTTFASTLAMIQMLAPFMIFALYAIMKRIDLAYLRAAAGLGARPFRAFLAVYLPLSLPGVINGATLVFITCLGFYVTPVLLGSPQDRMIAGLIADDINETLDFGGAAAASMVLLAATLLLFAAYNRRFGIDGLWR